MRKHGWQLPYHPLQVVAVAVFMALGFAFFVFFVPFVGRRVFQYVVMGIYSPLVTCVFFLYIWCAATDPGDPGVFRSKKYLNRTKGRKLSPHIEPKRAGETTSPNSDAHAVTTKGEKSSNEAISTDPTVDPRGKSTHENKGHSKALGILSIRMFIFQKFPFSFTWRQSRSHEQSPELQMSEDGMFYCSLCEVEVFKYSKHCRVCDKCVDGFDHHCRWLNNCIGKRNYRRFFTLMVSALLLLVLQWSIGILVMVRCFLEQKQFTSEIVSKLGSSFSLVPFVVVVASCTVLAMIATLPLAQLFFFHVLLIKKGISTYDYIIALREQEQQGDGGQHSPQMSPASSLTGLSSASSFNTFHRGAWCTPPHLFLEDQFDVVAPEVGMPVNTSGKRVALDEALKKKKPGPVKISPWALSRLNAEEVSKVAAEVRKKSRVMQPVLSRGTAASLGIGAERSFVGHSNRNLQKPDSRRRAHKRGKIPSGLSIEPAAKLSADAISTDGNASDPTAEASNLAPLQLEARNAFPTSEVMSAAGIVVTSSPESSLGSSDHHPFQISEGSRGLAGHLMAPGSSTMQKGLYQLPRSTSDGYEASGGEDSDWVPSRFANRSSSNWGSLFFGSGHGERVAKKPTAASTSAGVTSSRKP